MPRPRLLYLVTEDWYFVTHRMPMARAARDAGYEIHVATRIGEFAKTIAAEGFRVHALDLYRGSINPFRFFSAIASVRRLYRQLSPTLVHHIALQPSVVGAIAARGLPLAQLNSIFGFGSSFTSNGLKARMARLFLRPLLPRLFNVGRSMTMVVNPDHRALLIKFGVVPDRIAVIPGSGVDLARFTLLPELTGPIAAGYAGRMLNDKGVRTLVEAQQRLVQSGKPIQLLLAGTPDPANPNSISQSELEEWSRRPGVVWLGHVSDIREVWAKAHVAVLASHGEGLPMSLVEAAACGRALVATDVSGCREIARDGINAILIPVDDVSALANALSRLTDDPELRQRMAAAGRRIVEAEYSSDLVADKIVALYHSLSGVSRSTR